MEAPLFDYHCAAVNLVGWVERSDTHQSHLAKMMGFAKGSTHPTNYSIVIAPIGLIIASEAKQSRVVAGTLDCFASLAMTGRDIRSVMAGLDPAIHVFVSG